MFSRRAGRIALSFVALAGVVAVARPVRAEPPRTFALGIGTIKEHGFGGLVRLRFDHAAFDASVGAMPVLVLTSTNSEVNAHYGTALHLDGSAVFFFNGADKKFQNGIRAGGLWDSIMGPGALLGWVGDLCWERLLLGFGLGIQVYPDYSSSVKGHFNLSGDPNSFLGIVQLYLGVNIGWYIF